jgi:hypothetical protein
MLKDLTRLKSLAVNSLGSDFLKILILKDGSRLGDNLKL